MLTFIQFILLEANVPLYHGTASKYLSSILKHGIEAKPHGTYSQPENKVFVTTNLQKAHREAKETTEGGGYAGHSNKGIGSHPIVLKIHPKLAGKGWKVDKDYHGQYGVEPIKKNQRTKIHAYYKNESVPGHAIEGHYDHTGQFHHNPNFKGSSSISKATKTKPTKRYKKHRRTF